MAQTHKNDIAAAIQTYWSSLFMDELRQQNILMNLVNRDYEGEIKEMGDTVKITQINKPTGQTLTIDGTGGDRTFTPEALSITNGTLQANKRFVSSLDLDESVMMQSMLDPTGPKATEIRKAMVDAVNTQINTFLLSLVAPTTTTGSTATMTATVLAGVRELAGTQKWGRNKPWYGIVAPNYWADMLVDTTLTSGDYVDDKPVIGGQTGMRRFGFNLFEDDSITDQAVFFHPDFVYFVTQYEPRFKVSDKHVNGEFAYIVSVDLIGGGVLGINGANKHTRVRVAA